MADSALQDTELQQALVDARQREDILRRKMEHARPQLRKRIQLEQELGFAACIIVEDVIVPPMEPATQATCDREADDNF